MPNDMNAIFVIDFPPPSWAAIRIRHDPRFGHTAGATTVCDDFGPAVFDGLEVGQNVVWAGRPFGDDGGVEDHVWVPPRFEQCASVVEVRTG